MGGFNSCLPLCLHIYCRPSTKSVAHGGRLSSSDAALSPFSALKVAVGALATAGIDIKLCWPSFHPLDSCTNNERQEQSHRLSSSTMTTIVIAYTW